MTKRKRFVSTSVLLSIGFTIIQFLPEEYRFLSIGGLSILTLILFFWSLSESIALNATVLTLFLPMLFTVGVGLFWFLLPASIFARIPVIVLYGAGIYALCLTANIYTVAAIRTIALLRAAKGVGFVLTLLTFFLIFDTILSFRWALQLSLIAVFLVSFVIFLQSFWSVSLEGVISKDVLFTSLVSGIITVEVYLALFFWPVSVVVGSLFLTVTSYVLTGLGQAKLENRIFAQTVKEYLLISTIVFIGMFIATSWSGN